MKTGLLFVKTLKKLLVTASIVDWPDSARVEVFFEDAAASNTFAVMLKRLRDEED